MSSTDLTVAPAAARVRLDGWRGLTMMAAIVLVGFNVRAVILSVPPVVPLIQRDLRLSYTETGLLTSLPVLVMGAAALPAGRLIARFGGRFAVGLGLALVAGGALLRALAPSVLPLYACTLAMSLGIALAQTSVPVLVRQWFPARIGLASALFTDGLILGETAGASLTVPVALGLLGPDAWAGSFVFWSIPVAVMLLIWLPLAPPAPATHKLSAAMAPSAPERASATRPRKQSRVSGWHLGIMLGSGSLMYFGMNAWIAPYNLARGHAGATPLALGILNAAQLPASLAITAFAQALAGRRWPFILAGAFGLIATVGWIAAPVAWQPLWAALFGGSSAAIFTLGFALPSLLAGEADVARLAGQTLATSYSTAFLGPLLGGALWDVGHLPELAFVPVGAAAIVLVILAALLPGRAGFGFVKP